MKAFIMSVAMLVLVTGCATTKVNKASTAPVIEIVEHMDGFSLVHLADHRIIRIKDGNMLQINKQYPDGVVKVILGGYIEKRLPLDICRCDQKAIQDCYTSNAELTELYFQRFSDDLKKLTNHE